MVVFTYDMHRGRIDDEHHDHIGRHPLGFGYHHDEGAPKKRRKKSKPKMKTKDYSRLHGNTVKKLKSIY